MEMSSIYPLSQSGPAGTRPSWAFALHFDEVVIVRVVDMNEEENTAEVRIFTITANRCFWPYMPQHLFRLSCSELLYYLPDDQHPIYVPHIIDSRAPMQRGQELPVSLPSAAWNSFMSIRDAHHAKLKDRSLAARKEERREALERPPDEENE